MICIHDDGLCLFNQIYASPHKCVIPLYAYRNINLSFIILAKLFRSEYDKTHLECCAICYQIEKPRPRNTF